ncbi:MAG: amino acid adenylation domain-containing protein [Saprospiraceae bacterium]|nr:amino acid adenylation domain-containing protein [Saprospiraceae bacterium]
MKDDLNLQIIEGFKMYLVLSLLEQNIIQVQRCISKRVVSTPSARAVRHEQEEMTYQELEDRSNAMAHMLLSKNLSKETCVGVHLSPSLCLPIVVIGVLKAGGTYVPLSNDYPKKRIDQIIDDASITLIISDNPKNTFEDFQGEVISINSTFDSLQNFSTEAPEVEILDEDAAYIIYTSGSTGKPKGVIVEHGSLATYLNWYLEDLHSQTFVNLPLTSSISFAAGVTQLFAALMLGRTLHILNPDIIRQPDKLLDWYTENPGHGLYCVPTLWEEVMNFIELNPNKKYNPPACLYLSGEALSKYLVDLTYKHIPEISIWNLYGPTESTANVSYYEVQKGKEIFLGKPIRGAHVFLLDEDLNHVPQGEEGYIYITSQALARAYRNRPELSKQSFIKDHNVKGFEDYTIYNTGDIGKFNKDGELIFLGRRDQQIKIKGHRIELSEIERHLNNVQGIRQTACKVTTSISGNKQITAFVVTKENNIPVDIIRKELSQWLPPYMIPENFQFLNAMPKLANGKINRKKLVLEDGLPQRPQLTYDKVNASSDLEKEMLNVWSEIFGYSGIGITDDFFDLGGDSLKAIKMVHLVKTNFDVNISIKDIWESLNAKALCKIVAAKKESAPKSISSKTTSKKNILSLSLNQSSLWFINQSRPNQTAYNILFTLKFQGELDQSKVKKTLKIILEKHDLLRSNFLVKDGTAIRVISENANLNFRFSNITDQLPSLQASFEKETVENLFNKKFDLTNESLINFHYVKYSSEHVKLFVVVHHIIFDGLSMNIFSKEFQSIYDSLDNPTPPVAIDTIVKPQSYCDYVDESRNQYFSGQLSTNFKFWQSKLEGGEYFLNLSTDFHRPKIQQFEGANIELIIDKKEFLDITEFTRKEKVTPFILLLSVFKMLLYKHTQQSDISIGVPFANRQLANSHSTIGYFTNTAVYRSQMNDFHNFSELLNYIKAYTLDVVDNQVYPFGKLVEKLNPDRSVSYNPIFQVMFAYHNILDKRETKNGVFIELEEIINPSCKFDLDIEIQEKEEGLVATFNYNTSLFSQSTISAMASQFHFLLGQVIHNPFKKFNQFILEDKTILANKVAEWNDTLSPVEDVSIHSHLEKRAKAHPNRIAVFSDQHQMTYAQLNKRANQIAHYIKNLGIQKEEIIGIIMNRSVNMVAGIYGALKAGVAYLPINSNFSNERIQYLIEHSNIKAVFVSEDLTSDLNITCPKIYLDKDQYFNDLPTTNLNIPIDSSHLAYVVFTSGSTGDPKGVMTEHGSVMHRITWMQKQFPLKENDVLIQKTPLTFDVCVWELFRWTLSGSSLYVLPSEGEKNPEIILSAIDKFKVTSLHVVPSMFNAYLAFLDVPDQKINLSSLRTIFTTGEALEHYHVQKFRKVISPNNEVSLINFYGPTEVTIAASWFDTITADDYTKVPIGKPMDNTQIYILDNHENLQPVGIPGELVITGRGLARGYLNNPSLTKEKYKYNKKGIRYYKTGDKARWLPNGQIEFLGRSDHQVKIRGFRIELGEIENEMNKHPKVDSVIVLSKKIEAGDDRLVSYYIPKDKSTKIDFRSYLKKLLPGYMIPTVFIPIDNIPIRSNGKLDAKKLPEPFANKKRTIGQRVYNNSIEQKIAGIWFQILKHDAFDIEDNFYDVGGSSILIMNMKLKIDAAFKSDIAIIDLFQYSTIKSLAEEINSKNKLNNSKSIKNRAALQRKARMH